jgi:hypothetical protein
MLQSGMPEDTAEKIFEGFSQESTERQAKDGPGGMGIFRSDSRGELLRAAI